MAVIPIKTGGGSNTDFVTAIASDIRQGKVGADVDGNPVNGTLDASGIVSGNKALNSAEDSQFNIDVAQYATVSVSGVGSSFVGSAITRQAAKTVTPSTSEQTAVNSGVYTTGAVKVGAIPNQTAGGDVRLTSTTTSSTFAAGKYSTSRHYVYVNVYAGSVS